MQTDFLEASYRLKDLANKALDADRPAEWISLLEMAFTSATASAATLPISFKIQPKPLLQEGFVKPEVPKFEFFEYRTLIDVDGWTNAWSLLDKMIGGTTILKVASAKGYRQWFYDRLMPWENFIPLALAIMTPL